MNRRNFLKAVGVGVGYLALPSLAAPKTVGVINHKRLLAAMEDMFICKEGAASAYMEWDRMAAFQYLTSNAFHAVAQDNQVIRLTYQTFAYSLEGGTEDEAQAKLSQYFYKEFKEIAKGDEKKMLIWRLKPQFSSEEVVRYGKTWMTAEEIEDRPDLMSDKAKEAYGFNHAKGYALEWAFTPPRVNTNQPIMVPEGVEYDWQTDSLRYVEGKTTLHKLRMRLVIPEVMFETEEEYHPLAKPDGSTIPRLEA